ncbi:cytochrome P450 [Streptomyces sp. NPDC088745]|uniref:cytochrome P450 n=1 Tax=Streptomyces sp. NPDC088745 TaxID=3365884 RepID=UPI00380AC582
MMDSTLPLLLKGYAWLPDRHRREGSWPVHTRLAGRRALALHGPDAVRWFYDEHNVVREGALPGPLLDTLFGRGAVHTLDGGAHRVRKSLFMAELKDAGGLRDLSDRLAREWDRTVAAWPGRDRVVLFDEVSEIITRAVCDWAGVALPAGPDGSRHLAADLVAMVDGFATAGPRHFRARRARARQEARIAELVTAERRRAGTGTETGGPSVKAATAFAAVAHHRDADGALLDPHTAAVEVLNVIRPTVAVSWYVAFAAHALHRWPEQRERLAAGDPARALAFAQEVRRFYPFAPFVAGLAADTAQWDGRPVPAGTMVVLDLYGHDHDPALFPDPYAFDPGRFLDRAPGRDELVPQGGGDPATGHRCPGEDVTLAVLATLTPRLARLAYDVPEQDLRIPLNRMPTRPRSGFVLTDVRTNARETDAAG